MKKINEEILRIKQMMRLVEEDDINIEDDIMINKPGYGKTGYKDKISNEEDGSQFVIFVSGIETAMSHQGQLNLFKEGFGSKYPVKGFKYAEIPLVNDFISKNSVIAVVLFSAGAAYANKINNISTSKIYCIEPWNDSSNSRASRFESIPASNMYIDNESYARGKGTKKGANFTDNKEGHFQALKTSAKLISEKI
jgi:hypothetical protein